MVSGSRKISLLGAGVYTERRVSEEREKPSPEQTPLFGAECARVLKKSGSNPRQGDLAPAFQNEGARSDLGQEQTRKPPSICNDTPKPHGAQSKSVISTSTEV